MPEVLWLGIVPVLVVGADTTWGLAIVEEIAGPGREVRVFISDPDVAGRLRSLGVKVATGDVSDGSHVEAAARGAFTVILVGHSASDQRERAFASSIDAVYRAWQEAASQAAVSRIIWILDEPPASPLLGDVVLSAGREPRQVAAEVAALDDAGD